MIAQQETLMLCWSLSDGSDGPDGLQRLSLMAGWLAIDHSGAKASRKSIIMEH
jgi:hypothetical protein